MTDAEAAAAVYAPPWRPVIGALRVVARATLLLLAPAVAAAGGLEPEPLLASALTLAGLPALAARLLERAFAARVTVGAAEVVAHGRGRRIEIARDAIAGAQPWAWPLPGPGLTLVLRSGRRVAVALADPGTLLARLGLARAPADPAVAWAAARARRPRPFWNRPLVKFPLFALAPAVIVFRAHQWIAYGGTFGQYYLFGLRAYLQTFAVHWATVTVYLIIWANLWRVVAEAGTLVVARVAPTTAPAARRLAERGCALLYWAGVPALLALRFLP